ncbi:MAG: DUF2490 domain-containing protein [Cyclobacteriaceae bacterium]
MNSKKYIPALLFLVLTNFSLVNAQSAYRFGTKPSININKGLPDDFSINFKAESRQSLASGTFSGESFLGFDYQLTDLSLIASKRVGLNNKLAGGYLIRLRNGQNIHKAVQQFTLVRRYTRFRMAHRFASDQAFATGIPTELRLRYRVIGEFPLNGESVDIQEFYLKISNEYINAFQKDEYDLEIRLAPLLGYVFSENNKFEFGLNYRISSFLNASARNSFWLSLNWYLKV